MAVQGQVLLDLGQTAGHNDAHRVFLAVDHPGLKGRIQFTPCNGRGGAAQGFNHGHMGGDLHGPDFKAGHIFCGCNGAFAVGKVPERAPARRNDPQPGFDAHVFKQFPAKRTVRHGPPHAFSAQRYREH